MKWKFFLGATILTVGLMLKVGAPLVPIAVGVAGAAFINWKKLQSD